MTNDTLEKTETPKTYADALRAWLKKVAAPRGGSRAHLVPMVAGAALAVIVVAGLAVRIVAHHKQLAAARARIAVTRAPATRPQQPPIVVSAPAAPPTASLVEAGAQAPAATPAAVIVSTQSPMAPPAGLVPGEVLETVSVADQFGRFTQAAVHVAGSTTTSWRSHVAPAGTPGWKETIAGWFRISTPVTIAVLRRDAGVAADSVSATIDGAPLGAPLGWETSEETATLPLAAGWHKFEVEAEGGRNDYVPRATAIELDIGDGTNEPTSVVPYAVAPVPVAVPKQPRVSAEVPASSAKAMPAASATSAGTN